MMKTLLYILSLFVLFISDSKQLVKTENKHNAKCTGSAYCNACSNCSRCGHCGSGGSCGVCSGASNSRSFYSSKPKKKKTTRRKKTYTNTYSSNNNTNSIYYNNETLLTESSFLFTVVDIANIREFPNLNAPVLEQVNRNTKLIFLEKNGSWYKIIVDKSKTQGYIYNKLAK